MPVETYAMPRASVHLVIDAHDCGEGGYDPAPALRVAVTLLGAIRRDQLGHAHSIKLGEAGGILTACAAWTRTPRRRAVS